MENENQETNETQMTEADILANLSEGMSDDNAADTGADDSDANNSDTDSNDDDSNALNDLLTEDIDTGEKEDDDAETDVNTQTEFDYNMGIPVGDQMIPAQHLINSYLQYQETAKTMNDLVQLNYGMDKWTQYELNAEGKPDHTRPILDEDGWPVPDLDRAKLDAHDAKELQREADYNRDLRDAKLDKHRLGQRQQAWQQQQAALYQQQVRQRAQEQSELFTQLVPAAKDPKIAQVLADRAVNYLLSNGYTQEDVHTAITGARSLVNILKAEKLDRITGNNKTTVKSKSGNQNNSSPLKGTGGDVNINKDSKESDIFEALKVGMQ